MARQSVITQKKRGPAATGKGTLVGVRLLPEPLSSLDEWAQSQPDAPTRPEAIRRLIELGLKADPKTVTAEEVAARLIKENDPATAHLIEEIARELKGGRLEAEEYLPKGEAD